MDATVFYKLTVFSCSVFVCHCIHYNSSHVDLISFWHSESSWSFLKIRENLQAMLIIRKRCWIFGFSHNKQNVCKRFHKCKILIRHTNANILNFSYFERQTFKRVLFEAYQILLWGKICFTKKMWPKQLLLALLKMMHLLWCFKYGSD